MFITNKHIFFEIKTTFISFFMNGAHLTFSDFGFLLRFRFFTSRTFSTRTLGQGFF